MTEQVRQLVQCGNTMYAVGTFTEISGHGTTFARSNIFSFSASAPYTMTSWNPDVKDGTTKATAAGRLQADGPPGAGPFVPTDGIVNSITFNGTDCADAYIGGLFTSVHGTSVHDIAEVDTTTGAVVSTFGHDANGEVETLLGVDGHILVGGYYTSINNSSTDPYMTSLTPTTGKDDGFLRLHISGHYQYFDVTVNPTEIRNQQLSHSGTLDLVEGDFTSVGGLNRQQIFMLNLSTDPATVTGWTSPEWDGSDGQPPHGYNYQCGDGTAFYIRAAAWSPNDSTVYIADTGFHPWNMPMTGPRTGLCDAAAAFPATQTSVLHDWINYTGCYSLYSVAADTSTAYFGGHDLYSENPEGCKSAGKGAISAPGFEALSPTSGALTFNPTRSRGLGADDMLLTSAGLWIASDNFEGSTMCAHVNGHAGICLLPYSAG